jgi:glycosyltransferase involved in cell wall biosynthesis
VNAPRLSVVMPVRDGALYVAEAVESILAQRFADFEFLIYDDGSSDDTPRIIGKYAERDPRITLFRGAAEGLAVWLREGVRRARGELVARMDADDVARPERFERQVAWLDAHPEVIALGTDVAIVDPERRSIRGHAPPREHEAIDAELLRGNGSAMMHPSLMFRREALLAAGNYRADYPWAEDLELYLRLAERGRLANLPETLLEYRKHTQSVNMTRAAEQRRSVERIVREARARRGLPAAFNLGPPAPTETAADCWHGWARAALGAGNLATARHYAARLLRAEPLALRSWRMGLRALVGLSLVGLRDRSSR